MSIFGSIVGAIFGHAQQQPTQQSRPAGGQQVHPQGAQGKAAPSTQQAHAAPQQQAKAGTPPPQAAKPQQPVDVAAVLDKLKADKHANLDWEHSIVDMMKLLDLDSSLSARQELAKELHYTGDLHDSASMNIWLHKQVMTKLAENGGKVPDSLKH
ncbi:MAG: DUF3597 domain-containing protein [Alphaproteobacteria bacterium]|nr:DUF3597 domain-containing protein [Alphaproteobacteria bacterium]